MNVRMLVASDVLERRRACKLLFIRLPCRPLIKFLYLYFCHWGFLDGRAGFYYTLMLGCYEFMISVKIAELKKNGSSVLPEASPSEDSAVGLTLDV